MDAANSIADPLGRLIGWIADYGIVGLIAIGAAERFVPVLPSYGLLVAIGIAAASGIWSVMTAIVGTVAGSLAGCLLLYGLTFTLSENGMGHLLTWVSRLVGMPRAKVDRMVSSFRIHQHALAFGAQLVPTVRLVSPVIAGLLRADARAFAVASMVGIIAWNSLFISVGHVAAGLSPTTAASVIAIKLLVALIAAEVMVGLIWRHLRRHG